MRISFASVLRYFLALRRAVAGAIAISPNTVLRIRERGPGLIDIGRCRRTDGKDKTSVGPLFLRNASFIRAISASLIRQTVISASPRLSSPLTRLTNSFSDSRSNRTARWRLRIISAEFLWRAPVLLVSPALSRAPRACCFQRTGGSVLVLPRTLHTRG